MRLSLIFPVLFALFCVAAPAAARPIDNRDYAVGLLSQLQDLARQEADGLEAGLPDSAVYLLRVEGRTLRVDEGQLVNLLAYMQMNRLLDPQASDDLMAKAAASFGMPDSVLAMVLEDPDAFAAAGSIAPVAARLRMEADRHKAAVQQEIADLRAFADQAGGLAQAIAAAPTWPPSDAGGGTTIAPVVDGGMTVDTCLSWATDCGQPAADEFCRRNGFGRALSFEWSYTRPTRTLVGGETCDQEGCGGFQRITCE
jgi:hypothetical protein